MSPKIWATFAIKPTTFTNRPIWSHFTKTNNTYITFLFPLWYHHHHYCSCCCYQIDLVPYLVSSIVEETKRPLNVLPILIEFLAVVFVVEFLTDGCCCCNERTTYFLSGLASRCFLRFYEWKKIN